MARIPYVSPYYRLKGKVTEATAKLRRHEQTLDKACTALSQGGDQNEEIIKDLKELAMAIRALDSHFNED